MSISFKGIRNAEYQTLRLTQEQVVNTPNGSFVIPKFKHSDFRAELTNDNGRDKDTFQSVLDSYPNVANEDVIHISQKEIFNEDDERVGVFFDINNIPVQLNDDTLKLFIKMFDFVKRVKDAGEEEIEYEPQSLSELLCDFSMVANQFISENEDGQMVIDSKFFNIIKDGQDLKWVKTGAEDISQNLSDELNNFFIRY